MKFAFKISLSFSMFRRLIFPIKRLNHFTDYFNVFEQIVLYRNVQYARRINTVNLLLALKSIHFLYLSFATLNDLDHIIHYDGFFLLLPKELFNLLAFMGCWIVIYYNHFLFFKADFDLTVFLVNILIKQDSTFFNAKVYRKKKICLWIRKWFIVSINLFHSLALVGGMYLNQRF